MCNQYVDPFRERDFERDAQRICRAEKVSEESLVRDETLRQTSHKIFITSNCKLYCIVNRVLCSRDFERDA